MTLFRLGCLILAGLLVSCTPDVKIQKKQVQEEKTYIITTHETKLDAFRAANLRGQGFEALRLITEAYELAPNAVIKETIANEIHAWLTSQSDASLDQLYIQLDQASPQMWGWVELEVALRQKSTLAKDNLSDWIDDWPNHPGYQWAQARLDRIDESVLPEVKKAAVLLPLTGRFSPYSAYVYRGIEASCTLVTCKQDNHPIEFFYVDTNQDNFYQDIPEDVDIVLGPLLRSNIDRMRKDQPLNEIPVIALNSGSTTKQSPYWFGLHAAQEREAKETARFLLSQGYRSPVIVAANTSKGKRIVSAFSETWKERQRLIAQCENTPKTEAPASETTDAQQETDQLEVPEPEIIKNKACLEDYDPVVTALYDPKDKPSIIISLSRSIGVHDSQYRGRLISAIIDRPAIKHSRRRQDIDVVFFATDTKAARLLTPSLPYLYAGSVPAYGFSSIWTESSKSTQEMRDLSGLIIPLSPVDAYPEIQNQDPNLSVALDYMTDSLISQSRSKRLFAIGYDAGIVARNAQELESGATINALLGNIILDREITSIRNTQAFYRINSSGIAQIKLNNDLPTQTNSMEPKPTSDSQDASPKPEQPMERALPEPQE